MGKSLIDSGVDVFIGLQLYEQKLIIIKMKLRMRLVNTVHLALLLPILYSISFVDIQKWNQLEVSLLSVEHILQQLMRRFVGKRSTVRTLAPLWYRSKAL